MDEPVTLPKTSHFRWTQPRVEAALLVAEDELSDEEIAKRAGVSRRTLTAWKQHAEFAAMVGDHIGRLQAGMLKLAVAKKRKRVETLDQLHRGLLDVIKERTGEYPEVAGSETGLIVRQIKQIGTGRDAQIVEEYAVDTATIRQILAIEQQAAQELGQWADKVQVEGMTTVIEIVGVPEDAI